MHRTDPYGLRREACPSSRTIASRKAPISPQGKESNVEIPLLQLSSQIEVFYPGNGRLNQLHGHLRTLQQEEIFYYEAIMPLADLLSLDFLHKYVYEGDFYAISKSTPNDCAAGFALLPKGQLFLSLSTAQYEKLGVPANRQPKTLSGSSLSIHRVQIDLLSDAFRKGEVYYKRIVDRIRECVGSVKIQFCHMLDGVFQRVDVPGSFRVGSDGIKSRIEVGAQMDALDDIFLPKLPPWTAMSNGDIGHEEILQAFHEWIGIISCRFLPLLQQKLSEEPFVSSFTRPGALQYEEKTETGYAIRWRGFIPRGFIQRIVRSSFEFLSRENCDIPWVAVTVWVLENSSHLTPFHQNGTSLASSFTIICLKHGEYIVLK